MVNRCFPLPARTAITALALACCAPPQARAWNYLGVGGAWHEIKGDFDDTLLLSGEDAVYDIPTMDPGSGMRFVLGAGGELAFELSYAQSRHDAPGLLRPEGYPTTYHVVGLDLVARTGMGERLTAGHGQVYIRFGLALTRLRMNASGYDASPVPFDAEYKGAGFTLGAGFELKAPGRLRPFVEYDYRWMGYSSVLSRGKDIEIGDPVSGNGTALYAGLAWWR